MNCLPGTPCYDAYYHPDSDCNDCKTNSNNVKYIGPNLPWSGTQSGDSITVSLEKIDSKLDPAFVLDAIAASPTLKALLCDIISSCTTSTTTSTTSTTSSTTTIIVPDCSIFLNRESTKKLSLYNSVTHTNIELATLSQGCTPRQIAMDSSKMYMIDSCSNYLVYNYTISPFSITFDSQFTIWDGSYPSVNAGYGIAFKDSNTLFVVNSVGTSPSLVSDIYEYNLTTHIATPYMSISDNSFITSILYNPNNNQTVIAYSKSGTLDGKIQLYSGTTLLAEIALTLNTTPNALYYDGTNMYGVTQSGLIFTYDFVALTKTQVTPSVSYPDMQFPNVGGAGQHYTCYNFNILY